MNPDETQATGTDAPATADTADTQASTASEVENNQAPEATQTEAQGTQPEVTAEDTAETKLYAGKYKTPEEMEKAYKNLESKFGQTATEKAELSRILNDAFTTPATADTGDSFADEPASANQESPDVAILKFIVMHGNDGVDANAMNEVLKTDPYIAQISGHDAKLQYAYLRTQNMAKDKALAEAEKKGAQSATAKIAEKQIAQVESGKKTESDDGSELLTKATTGNPAEREAARKALIRKHLVNL